jgi:hypothetical protein
MNGFERFKPQGVTNMRTPLRQGDVYLQPTTKKPSAQAKPVRDAGRVILAYGEVTGHSHEVILDAPTIDNPDPIAPMELFEEPDGSRLLVVRQPATLRHQEHDPLTLALGTYRVIRQCEWSLDDVQQVAD